MKKEIRIDHLIISNMVSMGSRVLDVGCANGSLLHLLKKEKKVSGQGIEINHNKVEKCFEKGVMVRFTGNTIAISPPLIISKKEIDQIFSTLKKSIREVF